MTLADKFLDQLRRTKRYYEEDIVLIKTRYELCKGYGKFISKGDGQFTGGYYSEVYRLDKNTYNFCFYKSGELCGLTVVTDD